MWKVGSHLTEKDDPEAPFHKESHKASCFIGRIDTSQRAIPRNPQWGVPCLVCGKRRGRWDLSRLLPRIPCTRRVLHPP